MLIVLAASFTMCHTDFSVMPDIADRLTFSLGVTSAVVAAQVAPCRISAIFWPVPQRTGDRAI